MKRLWLGIKRAFSSDASQVAGLIPKGRHSIRLTIKNDAFKLQHRGKSKEVWRNVCDDKREFITAMVRNEEGAANNKEFAIVYRIMKVLAGDRKSFDGPDKEAVFRYCSQLSNIR